MLQQIAIWGGFAGLIVSVFAVIILYLTRQNILDILEKDVILFDRNFEIKKQVIEKAMLMVDEISNKGNQILSQDEFKNKAKVLYNELLCVVSDIRVADEFYNITLDSIEVDETRIAQFKLRLRKDIGLKTKHAKVVKRTLNKDETEVFFAEKKPDIKPNLPASQPQPKDENKIGTNNNPYLNNNLMINKNPNTQNTISNSANQSTPRPIPRTPINNIYSQNTTNPTGVNPYLQQNKNISSPSASTSQAISTAPTKKPTTPPQGDKKN